VNVTVIEQEPATATLAPLQPSLVLVKSAELVPPLVRVPTVKAWFPLLFRETVMAELAIPTAWSTKDALGGVSTAESFSATPLPERFAVRVAVLLLL
jgi:hypothetical protein